VAPRVGIWQDQCSQLKAALKDRCIPERKLLAHFQVGNPRELPTIRFADALDPIRAPKSMLVKK
jgi:hypothetical protein